ncbi:MAG TPA: dihydroorotase [Usitatibacteraceae bacterium]
MEKITITRPDDWHLHVRDGDALKAVLPDTVRQFARAIIMPNLKPPVRSVDDARAYRERIIAAIPAGAAFEPLMTLYLTDNTAPDEIRRARDSGFIKAVKYYPAGATTNSDSGVTDLRKCDAVFEAMQAVGLPLLLHGEVTDSHIDIFDREKIFVEKHLIPLTLRFPKLRMVLEHITTANAVKFVLAANDNVAATITAHHLLFNRSDIFKGGIRPHYYCLPVLKREEHRLALLKAATGGNAKFFLGTDSAPHARNTKEASCGCAGCYTALHAMALYAEAFESVDALDKLEGFASFHGADFYGLPRNTGKLTLQRSAWKIPEEIAFPVSNVVPLRAGETLHWRLA